MLAMTGWRVAVGVSPSYTATFIKVRSAGVSHSTRPGVVSTILPMMAAGMPSLAASRAISVVTASEMSVSFWFSLALCTPTNASDAAIRCGEAASSRKHAETHWLLDGMTTGSLRARINAASCSPSDTRPPGLSSASASSRLVCGSAASACSRRAASPLTTGPRPPRITSVGEICTCSNCMARAGATGSAKPSRQTNRAVRLHRIQYSTDPVCFCPRPAQGLRRATIARRACRCHHACV
jgi:hypothetical protein